MLSDSCLEYEDSGNLDAFKAEIEHYAGDGWDEVYDPAIIKFLREAPTRERANIVRRFLDGEPFHEMSWLEWVSANSSCRG